MKKILIVILKILLALTIAAIPIFIASFFRRGVGTAFLEASLFLIAVVASVSTRLRGKSLPLTSIWLVGFWFILMSTTLVESFKKERSPVT